MQTHQNLLTRKLQEKPPIDISFPGRLESEGLSTGATLMCVITIGLTILVSIGSFIDYRSQNK